MWTLLVSMVLVAGPCQGLPYPPEQQLQDYLDQYGNLPEFYLRELRSEETNWNSSFILKSLSVRAAAPVDVCKDANYKCKWVTPAGTIVDKIKDSEKSLNLEVAATKRISAGDHQVGAQIIQLMTRNMPPNVFKELAARTRVGLFTAVDKTTIYPEYAAHRDTPACAGTCSGSCSITCTGDGRKYDSLAGVGGVRGTCLDDNFMCKPADPYNKKYSVLVHEFSHTIHQYALPNVPGDWWTKIHTAWYNAKTKATWDVNSYAMSNHLEYFAEGATVFFNTNHHTGTGGMNSCGLPAGQYCKCPEDGRAWLKKKDPDLYNALVFTFTNNRPTAPGNLHICMTEPNNGGCKM